MPVITGYINTLQYVCVIIPYHVSISLLHNCNMDTILTLKRNCKSIQMTLDTRKHIYICIYQHAYFQHPQIHL